MEFTNKDLIQELTKRFNECKSNLGFKSSFEEIDSSFFIKDGVMSVGFVSETFSRQLCSRIVDTFNGWHGYLNGLLMPSPGFFAGQTESKLFNNEEDKKEIWRLIERTMELSSRHSLIGINKNKEMERDFIDDCVGFWKNDFSISLGKILKKINDGWIKD